MNTFIKSHWLGISICIFVIVCLLLVVYFYRKPVNVSKCPVGEIAVRVCGESALTCQPKCGLVGYDCNSRKSNGKYDCNKCNKGRKLVDNNECCDVENIHGNKCCTTPLCGNSCCAENQMCVNGICKDWCGSSTNVCSEDELCVSMSKASDETRKILQELMGKDGNSDKIVNGDQGMYACVKKDGDVTLNQAMYMPVPQRSNHTNTANSVDDAQLVFPCFLFDEEPGNEFGICTSSTDDADASEKCGKNKSSSACRSDGNCNWTTIGSALVQTPTITTNINKFAKQYESSTGRERSRYGSYCLNDETEDRQKRFVIKKTNERITDENRASAVKDCIKTLAYDTGMESVDFQEKDDYGYCIGRINCRKTLPVCKDGLPCPISGEYFEDPEESGTFPFLKCEDGQIKKGLSPCKDSDPCLTINDGTMASTGLCVEGSGGTFQCTRCPWYNNTWPGTKTDCNGYGDGHGDSYGEGNRPEYTYRKMRDVASVRAINKAGQPNQSSCKSALENSDRSYNSDDKLWADGASTYKYRDGNTCRMRWDNDHGQNDCYNINHLCDDRRGTIGHVCKNPNDDNDTINNRCLAGKNIIKTGLQTSEGVTI